MGWVTLSALLVLAAPPREAASRITQEYASWRAARVSNVVYDLRFELPRSSKRYSGHVELQFDLRNEPAEALGIDFTEGVLRSVRINEKSVRVSKKPTTSGLSYDGYSIQIGSELLKSGRNKVSLDFEHKYADNGEALARFVDPEDGSVYMFTDLEPFYANRVFPCFDQPDLKATFTTQVTVPKSFVVVTSERESVVEAVRGKLRYSFPTSPRMSTYVFSLHAGEYAFQDDTKAKVPSRLYYRKSLEKHIVAEEWFEVTRRGLEWFGGYFGIPYPFSKYDHVIAPAMNYEAMENIGAVTIQETFVPLGAPTKSELDGRARLIFHEMAHMWFGNLVTMKWWDDLWLNESFASIMSSLAADAITEGPGAWLDFNGGMKAWAYQEDQLPTTHPIAGDILTTDDAFASFDGITYGKGAAALKQLRYALGPEVFRLGVQAFLRGTPHGNADRRDFLRALETASGTSLSAWSDAWLLQAGLDVVTPDLTCEGGKIHSLALESSSLSRQHRTQIGFFSRSCTDGRCELILTSSTSATYGGPRRIVSEAAGRPCPDLMWPNLDDHDYVRVWTGHLETLAAGLSELGVRDRNQHALTRLMIWQTLWESVRDGTSTPAQYAEWVRTHLPDDEIEEIVTFVLTTLARSATDGSILRYFPREVVDDESKTLSNALWARFEKAPKGSDLAKTILDGFVGLANDETSLRRAESLLDDAALNLDPRRRWTIIAKLIERSWPDGKRRWQLEKKRDRSSAGRTSALLAEVSAPDLKTKKKWLRILRTHARPLLELSAVMDGLLPLSQESLRDALTPELVDLLTHPSGDDELDSRIAATLAPSTCTEASVQRLDGLLAQDKLSTSVRTALVKVLEEDRKCRLARNAKGERAQ